MDRMNRMAGKGQAVALLPSPESPRRDFRRRARDEAD
jgi:hypothetical protein